LTSLHSQSAKSSSSTIVLVGENKDAMLPVDAQCDYVHKCYDHQNTIMVASIAREKRNICAIQPTNL